MNPLKKILILAANPKDTARLRLDEEVREIKEGLQRAKKRDLFTIVQREAVRIRDFQRALLDEEPQIVHFSGHGEMNGIVLEDKTGNATLVEPDAIANLFELFADKVECVLLNACFSEPQAEAINKHIPVVIGMQKEIGDRAAIEFTIGFYDALGAGRSYQQAFKFGRNAIQLKNIPEYLTPVIKINPDGSFKDQPAENKPDKGNSVRIFISYKRDVTPDEAVATEIARQLKAQGYYVFIDQDMPVGIEWMKRIKAELETTDFLIPFLSEHSINSEMVKEEIETAYQLARERNGHPRTLPVRLNYREPFQYPLSEYLNHINWAVWDSHDDTPRLMQQLEQAITGEKPLPIDRQAQSGIVQVQTGTELKAPTYAMSPICLEMPEGTIDLESKFYLERSTDKIALDAIQRQGVTITIKGPRQMGKSSLLVRVMQAAQKLNKRVVCLDFQLFNKPALQNADLFYQQFCVWLTDELELDDKVAEYWNMNLGNSQRLTRYMQRHILPQVKSHLLLAMDEVETVFDTEFRSDFFGMLRGWHNKRSADSIWKNLDLALVTSTEPYQLIANLNQSPFNVGEIVDLLDFTEAQVAELNQRHDSPFHAAQLTQLYKLLQGHPYLVRKALYLVASQRVTTDQLFKQAVFDQGPFGDHLRYHLFRIHDKSDLVQGLMQIIEHQTCGDEKIFFRLRGAGLVRRVNGSVVPRCQLYKDYFSERLHG